MAQIRLSALVWAVGLLAGPASAVCTRSILAFSGDTCASIASANGITVQQFVQWNGGLSSCTLAPGRSYCVADNGAGEPATSSKPPTTTQPPGGLVVTPDGSCGSGTNYSCEGGEFGACCSEHGYCGDTQDYCAAGCQAKYGVCRGGECSGGASTTTVFVTKTSTCPTGQGATRTITSVSTITSTATTVRTVTTGGPGVTNTITVIRTVTVDKSVTITAPGGTRTVTVTTTTTKDGNGPIPTFVGTIPTCRRFYQMQEGDTCAKVVRQFGITQREFQYWNPQVDCGYPNDAFGFNVCVGIPGSVLVEGSGN